MRKKAEHEKVDSDQDTMSRGGSGTGMKPERTTAEEQKEDDLRPEYDLDYSRAKPNRFAGS